ncbi:unnamed protein product [Closterium sp. NIES-54]
MVVVLERQLHAVKINEGDAVQGAFDQPRDLYVKLSAAGVDYPENIKCYKALSLLLDSWAPLVINLNGMKDSWSLESGQPTIDGSKGVYGAMGEDMGSEEGDGGAGGHGGMFYHVGEACFKDMVVLASKVALHRSSHKVIDTGAFMTMTNRENLLDEVRPSKAATVVSAIGQVVPVRGEGRAMFMGADGRLVGLKRVLLVPGLCANLLSTKALSEAGMKMEMMGTKVFKATLDGRVLWDLRGGKDMHRSMWDVPMVPWKEVAARLAAEAVRRGHASHVTSGGCGDGSDGGLLVHGGGGCATKWMKMEMMGTKVFKATLDGRVLWDLRGGKDMHRSMWDVPMVPWKEVAARLAAEAVRRGHASHVTSGGCGDGSDGGLLVHGGGVALPSVTPSTGETDWLTAHRRFGHVALPQLWQLFKEERVKGLRIKGEPKEVGSCETCLTSKFSRFLFHSAVRQSSDPVELVHVDLVGPMKGAEFRSWLKRHDIKQQLTTAYTPQSNGVAQRANRTIIEGGRTILVDSGLPLQFWPLAIRHATVIKNWVLTHVGGQHWVPMEKWTGKKPLVDMLRVFGCMGLVHVPKEKRDKLQAAAVWAVHLAGTNRIWVPAYQPLQELLTQEVHDSNLSGHFGIDKILKLLQRNYYWPDMLTDEQQYVTTCPTCQAMKSSRQRPAGLLKPLEPPKRPWQHVTMDFVIGLPAGASGNDSVLVVVDRLTKMAHFAP